jgi:hypothetical protein
MMIIGGVCTEHAKQCWVIYEALVALGLSGFEEKICRFRERMLKPIIQKIIIGKQYVIF